MVRGLCHLPHRYTLGWSNIYKYRMFIREFLTEAIKARIDHPEDLVWQHGSDGVKKAVAALQYVASNPSSATLKFDGSPALIAGRDMNGALIVTDKSGFGATKYDGKPKSQQELFTMLYSRFPDQPGRKEFATETASLWPLFEKSIPADFRGYYQGDLMYVGVPPIVSGNYVFSPNKIKYSVPINSDLGQKIGASQAGFVVHSFYQNEFIKEPEAIEGTADINHIPEFLILDSIHLQSPAINIKLNVPDTTGIDQFLDPIALKNEKISDLKKLFGKYAASMAANGQTSYADAPKAFMSMVTPRMKEWIDSHYNGYIRLWAAMAKIAVMKRYIKSELDKTPPSGINATLNGKPGNEGYVAATPSGKIKLVDRNEFMRNYDNLSDN